MNELWDLYVKYGPWVALFLIGVGLLLVLKMEWEWRRDGKDEI